MVVTLTGNNKARCRRRVGRIPARLLRDFHVGRYGPFQKEMPRKCLFSSVKEEEEEGKRVSVYNYFKRWMEDRISKRN